jgi:hypothetical protein
MHNLIKLSLLIITLSLTSCSDTSYIEFNNTEKSITNLTDNYYLKTVIITEFTYNNDTIQLLDSNRLIIEQTGGRAIEKLSLLQPNSNYSFSGSSASELLNKEHLHFEIRMSKYEMWKFGRKSDYKMITFKSSDINSLKTQFTAK